MPKNSTCPKVIAPNSMNNIPISYGNNTTTQPIQWISVSFSIKISSWQIISRSHSRLNSTLILNSSKTILKRLNATDNAPVTLLKCNIPCSVQLVARKHGSQNAQRRMHLGIAPERAKTHFNKQPRGGGCGQELINSLKNDVFQHTAARRRLPFGVKQAGKMLLFQHTAARRWLPQFLEIQRGQRGFNTQPPKGGCFDGLGLSLVFGLFQHTATRRWLPRSIYQSDYWQRCFNTQPRGGGCCQADKTR